MSGATTPLEVLQAADPVDQEIAMMMAVQAADAIETIAQMLKCPRTDAMILAYTLLQGLDDDAYRSCMKASAKMLTKSADADGPFRADHDLRKARCGRPA